MAADALKILYIAGAGRSGSTLLASTLGEIDAFTTVGESFYLWREGVIENRLCGCGVPFDSCEFWSRVTSGASSTGQQLDAKRLIALQRSVARTRHLPKLLVSYSRTRLLADAAEYVETLGGLFRSVRLATDASVIVDASKYPSYAEVVAAIPGVEPFFVHLVRDPRAVAHSWRREKYNPASKRLFGRMGLVKSSLLWSSWNAATELLHGPRRRPDHYMRVRYEDFVDNPRQVIEQVRSFVGEGTADNLGFVDRQQIRLTPKHTMGGNPVRFQGGPVTLRPDQEWVDRLLKREVLAVNSLTWPFQLRYGYNLSRGSALGSLDSG